MHATHKTPDAGSFVEEVEVRGHIIDSLILPKILDAVAANGASCTIKHITIGKLRNDPSHAVIEVRAASAEELQKVLALIADHGAVPTDVSDCTLVAADMDGAYPEDFYSTTNQRTEVRVAGRWIEVAGQEMDCAILVDPPEMAARCLAMTDTRRGDMIVVGHAGVRVFPEERARGAETFGIHGQQCLYGEAEECRHSPDRPAACRKPRVGRPHGGRRRPGGGPHRQRGVFGADHPHGIRGRTPGRQRGTAAHFDIEQALFGTSLGCLSRPRHPGRSGARPPPPARSTAFAGWAESGRRWKKGAINVGVMYECVRHGVDFLLAGSIRDDGPLPDVVTDVLEAQRLMREKLRGVTFCLMIATTLHSIAVGN